MFIYCFFKQKTADEMRISDWSSDVCSSDLPTISRGVPCGTNIPNHASASKPGRSFAMIGASGNVPDREETPRMRPRPERHAPCTDPKSVVEGKSVTVRVDLGGRRISISKSTTYVVFTNLYQLSPLYL